MTNIYLESESIFKGDDLYLLKKFIKKELYNKLNNIQIGIYNNDMW